MQSRSFGFSDYAQTISTGSACVIASRSGGFGDFIRTHSGNGLCARRPSPRYSRRPSTSQATWLEAPRVLGPSTRGGFNRMVPGGPKYRSMCTFGGWAIGARQCTFGVWRQFTFGGWRRCTFRPELNSCAQQHIDNKTQSTKDCTK